MLIFMGTAVGISGAPTSLLFMPGLPVFSAWQTMELSQRGTDRTLLRHEESLACQRCSSIYGVLLMYSIAGQGLLCVGTADIFAGGQEFCRPLSGLRVGRRQVWSGDNRNPLTCCSSCVWLLWFSLQLVLFVEMLSGGAANHGATRLSSVCRQVLFGGERVEISALRGLPDPSFLAVVVGQSRVVATAPQSSRDKAGGPRVETEKRRRKKNPTAIANLKLCALFSVDAIEIVEAVAWWCCGSDSTLTLSAEKCCPSSPAYAPRLLWC
jgi:hypothetical protein